MKYFLLLTLLLSSCDYGTRIILNDEHECTLTQVVTTYNPMVAETTTVMWTVYPFDHLIDTPDGQFSTHGVETDAEIYWEIDDPKYIYSYVELGVNRYLSAYLHEGSYTHPTRITQLYGRCSY